MGDIVSFEQSTEMCFSNHLVGSAIIESGSLMCLEVMGCLDVER